MVDALEITPQPCNEPIVIVETDDQELGRRKTIKLVYTFFILLVYFVGVSIFKTSFVDREIDLGPANG